MSRLHQIKTLLAPSAQRFYEFLEDEEMKSLLVQMETLNQEISRNHHQQKSNLTELTDFMPKKFRNQINSELSSEQCSHIRSFKGQFDSKGVSVAMGTSSLGKVKENIINYYKNMHLMADLTIKNN